ncbi:RidA family protein [Marinobacterium rhizophilum]|uniref:RidA family protein n=1 Tax=Marinobacterium rhizophilum TaxID=420402 RepID=A0ABY5HG29_9GAMM|nr:RidA family protein [Marinobacterium rhizophilum]UTW11310.1 RidA family protein [Marinobacterium rhizophilum]
MPIERFRLAGQGAGGQELPFAKATKAGGFLFVSGQVALENGEVVEGGIVTQTRKAIENVKAILEEAGYGLEDVVKVNAWLDDPRDFWSFNGVFKEYFQGHPPARSTVVSPLVVDAKVEIDVTAYRDPQ